VTLTWRQQVSPKHWYPCTTWCYNPDSHNIEHSSLPVEGGSLYRKLKDNLFAHHTLMTSLLNVPTSALPALFMADASYSRLVFCWFTLFSDRANGTWSAVSQFCPVSYIILSFLQKDCSACYMLHACYYTWLTQQPWRWGWHVHPWSVVRLSMDYMTLYIKRLNASILNEGFYFVETIFTKLTVHICSVIVDQFYTRFL
jgi:hypothetical protein